MEDAELRRLYAEYAVPLKKYALRLCRNDALADDLTAEAFFRAVQSAGDFEGDRVFPWLCRIARNRYFDWLRKKERADVSLEEVAEPVQESASPEEAVIRGEECLALYRAIAALSPERRDVVYLRSFAGLSFREIGTVLGKSENWARVVFYRSRIQLKGWMEDEMGASV